MQYTFHVLVSLYMPPAINYKVQNWLLVCAIGTLCYFKICMSTCLMLLVYIHADLITSDSANLYFMLIYSNIAE